MIYPKNRPNQACDNWSITTKTDTVDSVAPTKKIRIKNNTQEWFDDEITEAIKIREKYFKKFKKSNLQRL